MPITFYTLKLEHAKLIAPKVRHLAFSVVGDDQSLFNYQPGQFLTIHFMKDDKKLRRSYSIATIPGKSNLIEIAAGYFESGPGTELLFGLQPGDEINVAGPFGRLILRDETPKRYLFFTTSTGITPFRAMLPSLAERMAATDVKVVCLEGVQTRKDLLYGEEFLQFASEHPNFEFRAHYSREPKDLSCESHECLGYVQAALDDLQANPATDIVYLCGNPGMIDETFEQLKNLGFDPKNIRREKYIS